MALAIAKKAVAFKHGQEAAPNTSGYVGAADDIVRTYCTYLFAPEGLREGWGGRREMHSHSQSVQGN